jgi:CHAD domain-containing protein
MTEPPAAEDHIEVEWQFSAFDVRPVARWLANTSIPGYTVEPGPTKHLHDVYYDTADWRLHRAGFTCRVRQKASGAELTLKSMAAAVDAVRSRREINDPLPAGETLPGAARGPSAAIVTALVGRQPLAPIFELRTERQIFNLSDQTGSLAEIALDVTTIPVGEDVPVRLSRVEVEVEATAVGRAQPFADLMTAAMGLAPAITSKFESALVATGHRIPSFPPDLGPDAVTDDMTAAEAAYAILRRQFALVLSNEAGTRLGEDAEHLHDMRVATRRMRAAMSAFREYVPRAEPYRRELGWLAGVLGAVRDLDVQVQNLAAWRNTFPSVQADAFASIEKTLNVQRDRMRARMLAALDSRRYARMVERITAWLRRGPPRSYSAGAERVLAVGPGIIERRYRRLRRHGDAIAPSSAPAAYHALRIDGKKLRYALEFLAPIYGRRSAEFARRVTALQDVLGLHQDAEVAISSLEALAHGARPRLQPDALLAIGALCERYRQQAETLRGEFPAVYRPLLGAEWRRLRHTMESRKPAPQLRTTG